MRKPNLELNIDRLVLHGVSPLHRRRVAEAMETELRRLFASDSIAPRRGSLAVGAQTFEMAPGLEPEQIGARIAQAVWASSRQAEPGVDRPPSYDLAAPVAGTEPTIKGNER